MLKTFNKKVGKYKHTQVDDYNKLKKMCYTILVKPTTIITKVNGKIENKLKLECGDYVLCGPKNEKYGLSLEKVLDNYDLGPITNKKVKRKGFKLTKSLLKKHNIKSENNLSITPSWGGKQFLKSDDYVLFENNNRGYYGINEASFKNTYN